MYEYEFQVALNAARAAGSFLRELSVAQVISENGRDIKLEADRESERIIVDALSVTNHPILSEESGMIGKQSRL